MTSTKSSNPSTWLHVGKTTNEIVASTLHQSQIHEQKILHFDVYCPERKIQILLPQAANVMITRALLSLIPDAKFKMIHVDNSEDMTENGFVPVVRLLPDVLHGDKIFENFEELKKFFYARGIEQNDKIRKDLDLKQNLQNQNQNNSGESSAASHLKIEEIVNPKLKLIVKASDDENFAKKELFYHHCSSTFHLLELYLTWGHEASFRKITEKRYKYNRPWPLADILIAQKRKASLTYLKTKGWDQKSINLTEAEKRFDKLCQLLVDLLNDKIFFFSEKKPCDFDLMVFGHLYVLMTTPLIDNRFADTIGKYECLVEFIQTMNHLIPWESNV